MTDALDIDAVTGLTEAEAARRLREEGYNELPTTRPRGILAIALDVVREPMLFLLVASGAIYLGLGELSEGLMLLGFVFVVLGITFYQERKSERALEALRDLSSPRALVIREGEERRRRIAGREVVRGDLLILSEGDRVPADAVLLSSAHFLADESLLTGESAPVRKVPGDESIKMGRPGGPDGEDRPFVYAGTLVVRGRGIARVRATGERTEIGRIGRALQTVALEETHLQRETGRLVRLLAVVGLSLAAVVVAVYGMTRGDWLNGFLAGITLAMAILPEEFPVILTVFPALGAWRMSQNRVLTRRVPTIETLGAATVLCVDKTGTLTFNRMSVGRLFAGGRFLDVGARLAPPSEPDTLPEAFRELVESAILASQRDPFDPFERALKQLGERALSRTGHLHGERVLVREYPLSSDLLAMSHVWRSPRGGDDIVAAKGAPEAIADLCRFDAARREALTERIAEMAEAGLRVLGVARASFKRTDLPSGHLPELPMDQREFEFVFLGLIGLEDPPRPAVRAALRECYAAGIRTVMITGDYPGTARSVARRIGLASSDEVITGPELERMDEPELRRRIKSVNLFARVMPEQKLRLVEALKANGEVVAMTGDGVNDAPALKSSHIGIAMGGRGTDVAREASDLVLLDDDFSSIVRAIHMGRRIFDNLRKAMAYIIAVHVPIAGMSLLPVLFKWPLVLMPVHIAFLQFIIDPACSIVFEAEPEEADVMARPPRDPKSALFGRRLLAISLLQGISVLVITLAVFLIALSRGQGEAEARALTFTTLIVANLGLIFTNRSWSRPIPATLKIANPALWWVAVGGIAFLGLVLYVPFLRDLFRFSFLHADDLAICLAAGIVSILWFEGMKLFWRRKSVAY